jgi:hypothetical protein
MHDSLHAQETISGKSMHDDACMHEGVQLLNEKCGVSLRVARDIATRYPLDIVRLHVSYALAAAEAGMVRKTLAAYVVASLRDNWGPPLGWKEGEQGKWYTDDEYDQFFVKPE